MKRIIILFLAAAMMISMAACGGETPAVTAPTDPSEPTEAVVDHGKAVLVFTGGLNGRYCRDSARGTVGYAAVKAYVKGLEKQYDHVILIDGGASADPAASKDFWSVVDACGYDIRVPGKMELSSGVETLKDRAKNSDGSYISCNLMDTDRNTTVFDPYVILDTGAVKLGFVGVTVPHQLEEGYSILGWNDGQLLRDTVQQAIDDAADAGAEYVIVVGNLGTAPENSPCTTAEVIAGITGLAAWLDCGSGAVLDGDTATDKDDVEIPLCAPGADFSYVGQVRMDLNDGSAEVELLSEPEAEDKTVLTLIEKLENAE